MKNGELVAEGKLYDDSSDICTDEILLYPSGIEPIPVTTLLLEKNGWVKDKTGANAFTHPQLGSDNKIVIKDDVPVDLTFKILGSFYDAYFRLRPNGDGRGNRVVLLSVRLK